MLGFGKKKSVEEMAAAAASAGIALRPGVGLDRLLAEHTSAAIEKGGFALFLALMGDEQIDPVTFTVLDPLSDDIWHFDTEAIEDHGSYTRIVENCTRLTGGELAFDRVQDFVDVEDGAAWIELSSGGKTERVDFAVENDWVDPWVFEVLAERLATAGSARKFAFQGLGQDVLIICKRPQQIDAINRVTGLRFK